MDKFEKIKFNINKLEYYYKNREINDMPNQEKLLKEVTIFLNNNNFQTTAISHNIFEHALIDLGID